MGSLTHRVLMAYRPLYLRGTLVEGQPPPRPTAAGPVTPAPPRGSRRRNLLVALLHLLAGTRRGP
ncbi:hypothetical protein [Frateuria defendens]|uniref:hypothetical protein n=1 Tax=Frateuria defendens TaxID=2219559 RepID=UPI00066FD241|nr:hypothetical protein [Frateuria defendens]